jgi:prolyl-tRNA synthetase
VAENIYQQLQNAGIEVLFDDRKVRAGFMFSDMELIGIPHRIVIGDRGLDKGMAEYRARTDSENQEIPLDQVVDFVINKIKD